MAKIILNQDHSGTIEWTTNGIGKFVGIEDLLPFLLSIDLNDISLEMEEKFSIGRDGILYYDPDMPNYNLDEM